MTTTLKYIGLAVAGIVVGCYSLRSMVDTLSFGGIYNQVQQNFDQGGFARRANGNRRQPTDYGTCNAISYSALSASSTLRVDCASRAL